MIPAGEASEVTGQQDTAGTKVLLASVDGRFCEQAIDEAVRRAGDGGGVYVVSTARVYGTALGLPHPGLYPSRSERETHRNAVAAAVRAVERAGLVAQGEVLATRHAAKMLARSARKRDCARIVVSAGPRPRAPMLSWAGEPYRLVRRGGVPVEVVVDPAQAR